MLILSALTGLQKALLAIIAARGVASAEGADDSTIIEEIQASGPGCPLDGFHPESGAEGLLFTYDDEMLLVYPDLAGGERIQRTHCLTTLRLHPAAGFQVSVAHARARGQARLDPGIHATHTLRFFFAGAPIGVGVRTELAGPFDGDYDASDELPPGSEPWSPCGQSAIFAIDSSLQLDASRNPAGTAEFRLNSLGLEIQSRPC